MNVEVIAIGTELLLGHITDTNSAWIGEQLALSGVGCYRQHKVGDNVGRIYSVVDDALQRCDGVILCGGLGPTQDDLTRQAIAEVMGVALEFDEDRADLIRSMFGSRAHFMTDNNLLQAFKPVGSNFIEQQPGTAPGLVCNFSAHGAEKVIYAVPGVPWEMKEMMTGTILPDLRARGGQSKVIASRTIKTWGETESGLAERLSERISELDHQANPNLAFLASGGEGLKVRITASAESPEGAAAILDDEEATVRALLGDLVFGADDETIESVVLSMLGDRGWTLAVAESLTGGHMASRLVAVPGASKAFRGGVVAYDSAMKFSLLGVPEGPVMSEDCARAMASGVRGITDADVGIGVTGVAGPTSAEGQRPGTVYLAIDILGEVTSMRLQFPGQRQQVREFTVISALKSLHSRLLETPRS